MPDVASSIPVSYCKDSYGKDQIVLAELNLDDLSPEILGFVMERLFEAGALDVYLQPIHMKKNRVGQMLSVIYKEEEEPAIVSLLFKETSTLGFRRQLIDRVILDRDVQLYETEVGPIRFKQARMGDVRFGLYPEYEDLKRMALETGKPLKELYGIRPLSKLEG